MNHSRINFSTLKYSGIASFATMIIIPALVILVVLLGYGNISSAFSQLQKSEAKLTALGPLKTLIPKPTIGLVNGIVYDLPNSTAIVDNTTVRKGDKIYDVIVVSIHRNSVTFAKDGMVWIQGVSDKPNAAWTANIK